MEYKDIRENLEEMMNDNYKDFIKALVSIEKGVNDEKALEEVYVLYMIKAVSYTHLTLPTNREV